MREEPLVPILHPMSISVLRRLYQQLAGGLRGMTDRVVLVPLMAYAATVTLHDAEGEAIHTIRCGRMPKGDVRGLCRGLSRDVTTMRAQRPELKVAYLTDAGDRYLDSAK